MDNKALKQCVSLFKMIMTKEAGCFKAAHSLHRHRGAFCTTSGLTALHQSSKASDLADQTLFSLSVTLFDTSTLAQKCYV